MTYRNAVQSTLAALSGREFASGTCELLSALGYRSSRIFSGLTGESDEFIRRFPAPNPGTATERALRKSSESVRILFQFTDAEIEAHASAQGILLEADAFNQGNAKSFLFVAVELRGEHYARGQYTQFTREINRRFSMPTVVLFRTNGLLTLAFAHRRPNKRNENRDVLGAVSLIREVDPTNPHRAHLDILADLGLDKRLHWMKSHGKSYDFDGLLAAWLDALDTEALNKCFYRELFDWFTWAVDKAAFPADALVEQQVIRLITRLLFVWFIKEKGLVREEWFVRAEMEQLLNDFGGSDYYRAVLQNLFFATLNTEMGDRRFSTQDYDTHRVFSRYRYRSLICDSARFIELMEQTPFINGGLFECLDSVESRSEGGKRIDMFSDPAPDRSADAQEARRAAWRELDVPNHLFFDEERGLFPLFNRYKFTVEENTPAEQEVALDPELLGKVFENLLAAYNPETRDTARKQTGSYYTPRPVVNYMVEESLVVSLTERTWPDDGDAEFWQARLRYLLDYADAMNDADELFSRAEKRALVRAIANIKVLDPAVGSGAFPMAILHRLTLALRRLDPNNELWESLQKKIAGRSASAAFDTNDRQQRDAELHEISVTFEKYRDSDFGRKLYLIQNSIYGVDIQTIACQIAKLRFFISLAIEQETDETAGNYGIKPLPNLETRFVAADTLLGLRSQRQLSNNRTSVLERELRANRERHFHANTRQKKIHCIEVDKKLRSDLATELEQLGVPADSAQEIAHWDPYDQNASADWFDAEYMFGVKDGFDVVIGNPPYIQLQKNNGELRKRYMDSDYDTFVSTGDIYQLFYERGCQLLRSIPRIASLYYI